MIIKPLHGPTPQGTTGNEYDVVYLQAYNNHSALIPAGGHVCYDHLATAAQWLGRAVTRPATANLPFYAGCAPKEIPLGEWGLVCIYGVMEEMGQDGGTTDTVAGQRLNVLNANFYAGDTAATTLGTSHFIVSMEAVTTATGTGRGLIRGM